MLWWVVLCLLTCRLVGGSRGVLVIHDGNEESLSQYSSLLAHITNLRQHPILLHQSAETDFSDIFRQQQQWSLLAKTRIIHDDDDAGNDNGTVASLNFSSIIILSSSTTSNKLWGLNATQLLNFINFFGVNLIVLGAPNMPNALRQVGAACGVEYESEGFTILDPLYTITTSKLNNFSEIKASTLCFNLNQETWQAHSSDKYCILMNGASTVGMQLEVQNTMLWPLLQGSEGAMSVPSDNYPARQRKLGTDLTLIAALQARNGARLLFTGSSEIFSDQFVKLNHSLIGEDFKIANDLYMRSALTWILRSRKDIQLHDCWVHDVQGITDCVATTWIRISGHERARIDVSFVTNSSKDSFKTFFTSPQLNNPIEPELAFIATQSSMSIELPLSVKGSNYSCYLGDLSPGWHIVDIFIKEPPMWHDSRSSSFIVRSLHVFVSLDCAEKLMKKVARVVFTVIGILSTAKVAEHM